MRRWNDRPATPAQFDLNRIRQIGDWGHASRHIGDRWEIIGLDLFRQRTAERQPLAILAICADAAMESLLASSGNKNPDIVLAFAVDEAIVLQPVDLKWSLDVASYRQISAPVLTGLLATVPRFCDAIRELLPTDRQDWPWVPRDGFFFCPRSIANERFLTSAENREQEYPIEATEAHLEPVDSYTFFEPMPGWATARELARLDGVTRGLPYLDNADRYYHLGAGVAGALVTMQHSIFEEETEIDPSTEVDRFKDFARTLSPVSTGLVIDRLGIRMRTRSAALRELRDLLRSSLSFKDYAAAVVAAGGAPDGEEEVVIRKTWIDTYRILLNDAETELRASGRRLLTKGSTDAEALEVLKSQRDLFGRRLRARARVAIEEVVRERAEA